MLESRDPIPKPEPSESVPLPAKTVGYVTLANAMRVTVDTVQTWVRAGKIIQPTYFGGRARWTEDQAKQILSEGTRPAGTYPPVNSPRVKQLQNLPKGVNNTLGYHMGQAKKTHEGSHIGKKPPAKKRGGK